MEDRKDFNPHDLLDRAVDSVLRGPIPDELPPDRVAQLAAVVRHAADQPHPISLIERIKNMKPRTKIAVAVAVLIALVGLTPWLVPGGGVALAFVDVAEALTDVQSARWKSTRVVKRPQGKVETVQEIGMFLAPSRERKETAIPGVPGGKTIAILDGRKAIFLNPMLKQATVLDVKMNIEGFPQEKGPFGMTFLGLRQTVVAAQSGDLGKAEPLGIEVIDGRRAVGFRMRYGHAETKIWADPKTSLPIRVEYLISGETEIHIVMTDFEIDPDLDESLFSLDVPEGYTVDKLQLDMPKNPLVFLAKTLGIAAELNGGVFPSALRGEQGLVNTLPRLGPEYLEKKYFKDYSGKKDPAAYAEYFMKKYGNDPAKMRKAAAEIRKATADLSMYTAGALAILNGLSPKQDWHYAGKDVKLNAPNRPIFWWKPPKKSGKYEVIYADLSVKEVGPEDVPKVPQSEGSPQQ